MAASSSSLRESSAVIRKSLRLRYNTVYACHEVYTTIHGSGEFRWFMVTEEIAQWYRDHFRLKIESYLQPSLRTGGIIDVPAKSGTPRDVYDKG